MSLRAIAIALKIPDNAAYTALVALRRLGVDVERVERCDVHLFDDGGDLAALVARVKSDETLFNPNKHRLTVLDERAPRSGETWIAPADAGIAHSSRYVGWRLYDDRGEPASRATLAAAVERLLCNPAIERAEF